jgi:predicted RND superfamily exporter protein
MMGNSESINEADVHTSRWTVRRAVTVLAVMAAVTPLALWQLRGMTLDNEVETWLPDDDPHKIALDWFNAQFGDEAGVLVSWEGSSMNDPRVEAFARELAGPADELGVRSQPRPGIHEVRTPRDFIRRMLDNDVDRETAVSQLLGVVVGAGPLKVRLTDEGQALRDETVEEIRRRAQQEIGIEVTFLPPAPEQQTQTAGGETDAATFRENEYGGPTADDPYPLPPRHDFQIRWAAMTALSPISDQMLALCEELVGSTGRPLVEECFFAPGAPVAVMVTMTELDDEQVERTMDELRKAARRVGVPEPDLHMGGSPYGRSALNQAAQGAVWNPQAPLWNLPNRSPVIMSGLVGIGLAFLVLKSMRLATLILLTDLFVAAVTTALLPSTGHTMNMVLIVMPNLLVVLTSSGCIHIANYWKHAAVHGSDAAASRAVKTGWEACALASVTTALGLASLLTSVLRPVREFGLFSAIGCLISLAAILIGFPSMLRLWRNRIPPPEDIDQSIWTWLGSVLYRHAKAVRIVLLLTIATGALGLKWFHTETKVIRYFTPESRIYRDYIFLEENLAGIAPVEVVVSFGEEAVATITSVERMERIRKIKGLVAAHPEISGTLALSDFRPPLEVPPLDAPFLVKAGYGRTVAGIDAFLERAQEEGHQGLVAAASTPLHVAFNERSVAIPDGAELWRIRAQVAIMTDLDYGVLTSELDHLVAEALRGVPGTSHLVTGMVPLFLRTQDAVVESLINSFALAFVMIALVMMLMVRHPVSGLITMLPNVQPIIVVFGLISWAGVPVDIGTMVTASVALGIAVDGTLHLLTWFRDGLRMGLSRERAISLALAHCGPAMWQTSAAIGLGMLMLAFADLLLISRFGWLMAALIGAALVGDIIFLPALLAGRLGTLMERTLGLREEKDQSTVPSDRPTASPKRDRSERAKPLHTEQR